MKILIITDSYPFPPKNGKDLPIAGIFSHLSQKAQIDVLILNVDEKKNNDFQTINTPIITNTYTLSVKKTKKFPGKKLYKTYNFNPQEVKTFVEDKFYDWAWVSPYPCYGFIDFCKKNKYPFIKRTALGLNDELSYVYMNRLIKMVYQKSYTYKSIGWLINSQFLKWEERKLFNEVNLFHVQTEKEKERLLNVVGKSKLKSDKIVVAANGINEDLLSCSYAGINSCNILCMTQLGDARKDESKWFFIDTWPRVKKMLPDVKLLVVGSPPKGELPEWLKDNSIEVLGYVDDLKCIYNQVSIAIVPSYHSSGLINRIQDALIAGVPLITTKKAIHTFPNVRINEDAYASDNPIEFAELVISLYRDSERKILLSKNGRKVAESFETWNNAVEKIYNKLKVNDR